MMLLLALLCSLTFGCTRESHPEVPPTIQSVEALPAFLEIKRLRILNSGRPATVLYEDGLLEDDGQPLGQIQKDGRFIDLLGRVLITMSSDGRIVLPQGEIQIASDGTISTQWAQLPREEISIEPNGNVIGTRQEIRIEGMCQDCRRIAAYALILSDVLRLSREAKVH